MASGDARAVVATDSFVADFDAASSYYARTTGTRSLSRFLDSYDAVVKSLETFPAIGTGIEGTDYRWRPVGVFVAVYRILEDSRTVSLMRLVYMSSNWKTRLESGEEPADL